MKKSLMSVAAVAALMSFACWLAFSSSARQSTSVPSFQSVVIAHGGYEAIAGITAYRGQGVRLTSTSPSTFFERQLTIEVDREKFRRRRIDPSGVRTQDELFDGQSGFYTIHDLQHGPQVMPPVLPMTPRRLQAVKASTEKYDFLSILQRCADPATKVVFQSREPGALDKFKVTTSAGDWFVLVDNKSHLIRQVEIGQRILRFADYRVVNGLRLPFIQRLSSDQRLIYELVFSAIELNPSFPADYFTPAALAQETAR